MTDWDHTELRRLQTITAGNDTQSPTPSRVIRVSSTDMLRVDVDVRRAFRAQLSREKIRPIVATPPTKVAFVFTHRYFPPSARQVSA